VSESYKRYRHPKSVIGYAVRLYLRYCLSYRDVQEILLERGIEVTYETIRAWVYRWGSTYASRIRKRRSGFNDKWHIDEVYLKINGKFYYLWRLVDGDGLEIDILLQKRRNAKAAKRFLLRALKRTRVAPRVLVADKLKSTRSARRAILPNTEFRAHKGLNNVCENSHQPTRNKERQMRKFKDPCLTQKLLENMGQVMNLMKIGRFKNTAKEFKSKFIESIQAWYSIVDACPNYI
jgi:putative transposase